MRILTIKTNMIDSACAYDLLSSKKMYVQNISYEISITVIQYWRIILK